MSIEVNLKEIMRDRSRFAYYQAGELVYLTTDNFRFTVPVEELGSSRLCVQEPNKLLMKWIKRQQEVNAAALKEQQAAEERIAQYEGENNE